MSTASSQRAAAQCGFVLILLFVLVGCGRHYPSPFTAQDMAAIGTGDALVHYLHQPGAPAARNLEGSAATLLLTPMSEALAPVKRSWTVLPSRS